MEAAMKHHGTDTCVMREDHVGKPADHGLMCEECRALDRMRVEGCDCPSCRSDMALIAPCMKEGGHGGK
jgi:hypothetical protein